MPFFGIDLGTSSCLAASLDEGLKDGEFLLECLHGEDAGESIASIVSFQSKDQYLVGEKAREKLFTDPDSTVELIKVCLGKTDSVSLVIDGEKVEKSPQEITALLLSHLNKNCRNKIVNPVLTVPAIFDQSQKDAVMQAGKLAQTSITQLIEEPTAAIIFQIFDDYQKRGLDFFKEAKSKNVLVFDFGGGTLDLSLICLSLDGENVNPEVIAIHGDPTLGGNNIDLIFMEDILSRLSGRFPEDSFICRVYEAFEEYRNNDRLRFPEQVPSEIKSFVFRLKRELERVKIRLSTGQRETIRLEGGYGEYPITREQFEQIVFKGTDVRKRIFNAIQMIIKRSNHAPVDEVLLVGGSSQIPYLQELILNCFDRVHMPRSAIKVSSDYSHAVALGAAIQAALSAGVSVPPFRQNKSVSVVARDIILSCGQDCVTIVESGTPYPFAEEKIMSFSIPHALSPAVPISIKERIDDGAGQTVEKTICDYQYHLPLYYTGDVIQLAMNIDSAGLYQVKVKHVPTKEKVEFESRKAFSLSEKGYKDAAERIRSMKDVT